LLTRNRSLEVKHGNYKQHANKNKINILRVYKQVILFPLRQNREIFIMNALILQEE